MSMGMGMGMNVGMGAVSAGWTAPASAGMSSS